MEKGINLTILEFKKGIINNVNAAGLPISVVSLVLSNILDEVNRQEQYTLATELSEYSNDKDEQPQSEIE